MRPDTPILFPTVLLTLVLAILGAPACGASEASAPAPAGADGQPVVWQEVSGTAIHSFTTALVHSQRSTETVELDGDLRGRILYHPVSTFDFVAGTLANTGHQVFSGTILGSEPVLLLDDRFEFLVDLATGATVGEVFLERRLDGPRNLRCELTITGTGLTPEGDATADYAGSCLVAPLGTVP